MRRGSAAFVAAGIFASRIFGLLRQRVVAHFFGQATVPADALAAAFRIPNFLQNLFGEGVLSASLIPEYTKLRAQGREADARKVAGAVAGLLALAVTIVVAAGVIATPVVVDLLFPGFARESRDLTIRLVRIMFPGVGLLVLAAWCLGILNSHRRFFLSYAAPVAWNLAIIAATVLPSARFAGADLVVWTAWGAVAGAVLQIAIQIPRVWAVMHGIRLSLDHRNPDVRVVVANFFPAALSRGVVQISAFVDGIIASWLPLGAVAALSNAQLLYTLPISLFGMSIAAAELPELSETVGRGTGELPAAALRERLAQAARDVAFFIVPSAVAFLALGRPIVGLVLQSGAFTESDVEWVWGTLAGSAVGLLGITLGRLYVSAHYALSDTRSPLRFAVARVLLTIGLGLAAALWLPGLIGVAPKWGTVGLTVSAGVAGWLEFLLLKRSLAARIGRLGLDWGLQRRIWAAALVGAGAAWLVLGWGRPGLVTSVAAILIFGVVYLALTAVFGVPTLAALRARFGRRR